MDTFIIWRGFDRLFSHRFLDFRTNQQQQHNGEQNLDLSKQVLDLFTRKYTFKHHNHTSYDAQIAPEGNTIELNVDLIVATLHQRLLLVKATKVPKLMLM